MRDGCPVEETQVAPEPEPDPEPEAEVKEAPFMLYGQGMMIAPMRPSAAARRLGVNPRPRRRLVSRIPGGPMFIEAVGAAEEFRAEMVRVARAMATDTEANATVIFTTEPERGFLGRAWDRLRGVKK